jgi:hypothetical protein
VEFTACACICILQQRKHLLAEAHNKCACCSLEGTLEGTLAQDPRVAVDLSSSQSTNMIMRHAGACLDLHPAATGPTGCIG